MAGSIKHMQRSHRSYSNKDVEFRRFAVKAIRAKDVHKQRKSIGERMAAFMAMLHIGRRHQDK